MIAKLIADAANGTETLFQELVMQAHNLRRVISDAHTRGQKVLVINPRCADDVFTDRWPASRQEQEMFLRDLDRLLVKLAALPESGPDQMRAILAELFGETPTGAAFETYYWELGQSIAAGRSAHLVGSGRVFASLAGAPADATATRPHTFFGRSRG
jgi:hypothetical protein